MKPNKIFRVSLSSEELQEILAVLPSHSRLAKKLTISLQKISMDFLTPAYSVTGAKNQSLESKLGISPQEEYDTLAKLAVSESSLTPEQNARGLELEKKLFPGLISGLFLEA